MHHLIINRAMAPSATSKAQQLLQVCLLVVVLNVMNDDKICKITYLINANTVKFANMATSNWYERFLIGSLSPSVTSPWTSNSKSLKDIEAINKKIIHTFKILQN